MSNSLPQGWEEKELSKIADYITEKIEVSNITLDNYISTENMNPNIGGVEKASSLPNVNKVNEFKKEDILFSNIRTYFKKIWFATLDGGSSTDVLTIRKKEKDFCSKYLYYSLTTENYFDYTVKTSKGTKMPRGDKNAIMQYKIKYPTDTNEQKRIADILSAFDDKIELNNQMNQTLEDMATALFKEWFENFNFPNDEGKAYKDNGGEFKSSELGEIPVDFEVLDLKSVVDKIVDNRGKTPPLEKEGIKLLESNQVFKEHSFPIIEEGNKNKYVSFETYNNWFRSGHPKYLDILCALVGNGIPKWCFTPSYLEVCIAQNIIAIRNNEKVSPYFLKSLFNTHYFISEFKGRIVTTAQPSVKLGHMMDIKIIVPKKNLIDKFDNKTCTIFEQIEQNQQQNQTLKKQRDTLLPKLMSGEIRV